MSTKTLKNIIWIHAHCVIYIGNRDSASIMGCSHITSSMLKGLDIFKKIISNDKGTLTFSNTTYIQKTSMLIGFSRLPLQGKSSTSYGWLYLCIYLSIYLFHMLSECSTRRSLEFLWSMLTLSVMGWSRTL